MNQAGYVCVRKRRGQLELLTACSSDTHSPTPRALFTINDMCDIDGNLEALEDLG